MPQERKTKTRRARRVTARYQWDRIKVSFWFAPVVMSLGAVLLTIQCTAEALQIRLKDAV